MIPRIDMVDYHRKVIQSYERVMDLVNQEFGNTNDEIFQFLEGKSSSESPKGKVKVKGGNSSKRQQSGRLSLLNRFDATK